jgi:hypothetical protein
MYVYFELTEYDYKDSDIWRTKKGGTDRVLQYKSSS